jgi:hypothetical protein
MKRNNPAPHIDMSAYTAYGDYVDALIAAGVKEMTAIAYASKVWRSATLYEKVDCSKFNA